ncbi:hypothetical protein LINPERHAP2_LOCUS18954 [Linum perenne]
MADKQRNSSTQIRRLLPSGTRPSLFSHPLETSPTAIERKEQQQQQNQIQSLSFRPVVDDALAFSPSRRPFRCVFLIFGDVRTRKFQRSTTPLEITNLVSVFIYILLN